MVEALKQESEEKTTNRYCEKHGDYLAKIIRIDFADREIESECPQCREQRIREDEIRAEWDQFHDRQYAMLRNIPDREVPPRFKEKSFANFQAEGEKQIKALATCKRYAEKFEDRLACGGGMVFCGRAGTGKTHLACSIIRELYSQKFTTVFCSVLSAIRHVKSTYSRDESRTESQAIADYSRPDLLVLDEVGVQFGTEAEKIIFFEIINQRYQQVKPTILISNLPLAELSGYIGDRVVDRMHEGGGVVLSFDWDSHRKKA